MNTRIFQVVLVSGLLSLTSAAFAEGFHSHGGHVGGPSFHGGAPHSGLMNRGFVNVAPHAGFVRPYSSFHYATPHYFARPSYAYAPAWHRYNWHGGYWHGAYWPRAYYYSGFPWFLAALPIGYTTFWYGSVPYYYVNDGYYTWNASDNGYVATLPPPVVNSDDNVSSDTGSGRVFAYPKQGQSEQQQAVDEQECRTWASDHAGDQAGASVSSSDYRRAITACLEGRGYSAK